MMPLSGLPGQKPLTKRSRERRIFPGLGREHAVWPITRFYSQEYTSSRLRDNIHATTRTAVRRPTRTITGLAGRSPADRRLPPVHAAGPGTDRPAPRTEQPPGVLGPALPPALPRPGLDAPRAGAARTTPLPRR